jgi:SAM-dependent methyltransferase
MKWNDHIGKCITTKNKLTIISCQKCGFKHLIPIPSSNSLTEYYKKSFFEKRPGLEKVLNDDYDWWKIIYNEKYDYFENFLKSNQRTILDVGCGLGNFLKVGKNREWITKGIDPSEQSVKIAKKNGLDVICGTFSQNFLKHEKFDVIHMHEVLEHLPNPIDIIHLVKDHLNPSGLLCIVSPNDFNPLQKILTSQGFSNWWVGYEHINYFNLSSLSLLLKKLGFDILFKTTTFPIELFLLMGDNYIDDKKMGRKIHNKRKNLEFTFLNSDNEELRRKIYKSFSKLNMGRELIIIARLTKNEK